MEVFECLLVKRSYTYLSIYYVEVIHSFHIKGPILFEKSIYYDDGLCEVPI